MTTQGALELLRTNQVCYPAAKPMDDTDMARVATLWEYQFRDWPDAVVKRAYLDAQKECVYPVSVADIYKHLPREMPKFEDAMRAAKSIDRWLYYAKTGGLVGAGGKKSITECTEEAVKIWNELPESVRGWAGTMGLLAQYADADESDLATWVRPKFELAVKSEILPPKAMQLQAAEERKAIGGYKPLKLKKGEPNENKPG